MDGIERFASPRDSYSDVEVWIDIFDCVELSFLPVGHTHEDVDQMFSVVERNLVYTNYSTLEDLLHCFQKAHKVSFLILNLF